MFSIWGVGIPPAVALILDDVVGLVPAGVLAMSILIGFLLLVVPGARRGRRARIAGDAGRGIAEAHVRFVDEQREPNHRWREGMVVISGSEVAFQQLRGPGGARIGDPIVLSDAHALGECTFVAKQAPGLRPHQSAFGFLLRRRELKLVVEPESADHERFAPWLGAGKGSLR